MSGLIRKIEIKDLNGFHSALSSVAKEGAFLLTVEPPLIERMENFVKDNIKNNNAQYVCEVNGLIIGWAYIIPYPRQTMGHVGSLGMGVIKPYRGKGYGKKLLKYVIDHAWSQGLKRLELEVFSDNKIAINLYKKMGYEVEGIKKYARFYNGIYQDIVVMAQYRT